jgi:hypothetical protein
MYPGDDAVRCMRLSPCERASMSAGSEACQQLVKHVSS